MKKGGEFIAEGADTCVYDPPLSCKGAPETPKGKYVSRVVKVEEDKETEAQVQENIRELVEKAELKYPGRVANYFNLMESSCRAFSVKATDIWNKKTVKRCSHYPLLRQTGEVGEDAELENIITPIQGRSMVVYNKETEKHELTKSIKETTEPLKRLLIALICVDGAFIHNDAHGGNIAWMPDGRLVLFDWGRAFVFNGFKATKTIRVILDNDEYYSRFSQFRFLVNTLKHVTQKAYVLSNVWDILAIMGVMYDYNIVDRFRIEEALDQINFMLPKNRLKQNELMILVERMFEPGPMFESPASRESASSSTSSTSPESLPPVRYIMKRGGAKQSTKFCRCIKAVRKTIKARPGSTKESGAIAVCNKSILQKRGRTLKKFRCGKKPYLKTQKKITQ